MWIARASIVCLAALLATGAWAYPRVLMEREPNDTPEQAQSFRGEARLIGQVSADDRDLFWWALDDADADHLWNVELLQDESATGIRATFTWPAEDAEEAAGVMEFGAPAQADEPGEPTELLAFGTSPARSVRTRERLIVPPGEHLISLLTGDGQGEYQLTLTQGDAVRVRGRVGPEEADPVAVSPGRQWFFQLDVPEHPVPLEPEPGGEHLWRLDLLGELGAPLEAVVEDAEGGVLGRAREGSPLQHEWGRLDLPEGSVVRIRRTDGGTIGRIGARLSPDGQRPAPRAEPVAGSLEEAIWIDLPGEFSAPVEPRHRLYLAFPVDAASGAGAWAIDVAGETDHDVEVCLGEIGGRDPVCRNGPAEGLFRDLRLEPRDHFLYLRPSRRADEAVELSVRLRPAEPPGADRAPEPNDARAWAAPLAAEEAVRGHLGGQRSAWFELRVTGEPQLWRVEADGENLDRLGVYHPGERHPFSVNRRGRRSSDTGPMHLDRLLLLPGRYLVQVRGEDTGYTLTTRPMGEPRTGWEQEPNDDARSANRLRIGEPMHGTLHSSNDEDYFYFHLPGWNRVVLDFEPPAGGEAALALHWQDEGLLQASALEEPVRFNQFLPPGDYYVVVTGEAPDGAEYRVTADLADPWSEDAGYVFAPSPTFAGSFPPDGHVVTFPGRLGGRYQYFRLPETPDERDITFETDQRWIAVVDATDEELELAREEGRYSVTLPGGRAWYLRLRPGRSGAEVRLDDPALTPSAADDVRATLELVTDRVPPWLDAAQRLDARLEVSNTGGARRTVPLESHVSHAGAHLDGLPDEVALAPGETRTLDLDLWLPPGLPADDPMKLFVRTASDTVAVPVTVDADAPPADPTAADSGREGLTGLTDMAWNALGAGFIEPESGEAVDEFYQGSRVYAHFLMDGMAAGGSSIQWSGEAGEPLPPLRLAGEGGRIHALVLNQRSAHAPPDRWRRVAVGYGDTPGAFEPLMEVELEPGDGEQFFPLDEPVDARYLQIRPLSAWGGDRPRGTGLIRVLGEPAGAPAQERANLLEPELGGHWIYTLPDISRLRDFPDARDAHRGVPIRGRSVDVVFGFLQHRAARLAELTWTDDPERDGMAVERVRVYTSTESPVGPWTEAGAWELERDADGTARFRFADSPWARYLRLSIVEPEPGETRAERNWNVPVAVTAVEAEMLGSGRSILAYWGMDGQAGPMEAQRPAGARFAAVEDTDSRPEAPRDLTEPVTGRVAHPGDARSYRVRLEAPDNTLVFTLDASRQGRLQVGLFAPDGEPVPLASGRDDDGRRVFTASPLEPGAYRLDVAEPPRNIVFIWDGSGSLANHQPAIYQALNRFAQGLYPGREVANLMALGGPLLIRGWAESPAEVTRTLAAYDDRFVSSDSEPALQVAARALERREGERVIFLITDAELVSRDLSVWSDLERVRPRIFALEINHGSRVDTLENRWYQNLMKAWANVADGSYHYTTDRTGLIRAFEDGMRRLRRPTVFALDAESLYREPPRPGHLAVISGDEPVVAAGVVHLIFDASGSMLRRMEGGRRIQVARRIVRQVLDDRIPDSVPVALRAFGHTEPHSCETELLVPPAPDNHGRVRAAVEGIQAINLARTPLAASLEAVLDDLDGIEAERRLVVMLTDGEETCDGDVEQAVSDLIEDGVNVRLNIVGFHIDEIGLQAEFERFAELGGGEYFDSHDGEGLAEGLARALAASYRVRDARGEVVARGRVDAEPVELEPGDYELVVETGDGERRLPVRISPASVNEISLSDEP